jgi:hypothetical protein
VLPAFIDQLLSADDAARLELVEREGELRNSDVLIGIADAVNSIAREDLPRAERLAEIGTWLADLSDDSFGRARIRRSFGNLQVLRGKHAEVLQTFDSCIEQFFLINAEVEVAATLSSSLQPLIYLSRYSEALERARAAVRKSPRNIKTICYLRVSKSIWAISSTGKISFLKLSITIGAR